MADQSPEQSRKHQHESDIDGSIQKRQKTDEYDEAANVVHAKTITNIYYDCLERIFDFLDLQSLLNVAGTCKRLQIAAAAKFADDFSDKDVMIACCSRNREPNYVIYQNEIHVRSLKSCFPFLRCFGAKISNLNINSDNDHVHAYINEFCADSLTSIAYFYERTQFPAQPFQKPFKLVKSIQFTRCRLLPSFFDWFPNIQHLGMNRCFVDATSDTMHLPHLERLEAVIGDYFSVIKISTLENFKNLFQANQQLQSVGIYMCAHVEFSTVLDMLNGNSSITNLTVVGYCSGSLTRDVVTKSILNRFCAEHPSVTSLFFKNYRFAADGVINMIQRLNTLKYFRFRVNGRSECDRLLDQLGEEWKHEINEGYNDEFKITLTRQ